MGLRKEIVQLKRKVFRIENILKEDFKLSARAKKELARARDTPKEKYIKNEHMLREFSVR